jgi:hypothetical protein
MRREVEHGVFLLGVSREAMQGGICCEYSGRPVCVLRSCGTQGEGILENERRLSSRCCLLLFPEERFCAVSIVLKLKNTHFQ